MEINSLSSNLNSVNNAQNNSVERISSGSKIEQTPDDASNLVISDALKLQRSDLSHSLKNLNEGIALTRIATDGLDNQKQLLEEISTKLVQVNTDTTSSDDKVAIKKEVTKLVEDFKNISETTKFNDQKLITPDNNSETLDISTSDETLSITIPNTGRIADELRTLVDNTDFNSGDTSAIVDRVDLAIGEVNETQSNFTSTESQLESSARNTIGEQVNLAKASSSIIDIDFGKEVTDFSKANILTQLGYLVSTQANAGQEQNIKLLV